MGEQLPIEGKAEVSFNLGGGGELHEATAATCEYLEQSRHVQRVRGCGAIKTLKLETLTSTMKHTNTIKLL